MTSGLHPKPPRSSRIEHSGTLIQAFEQIVHEYGKLPAYSVGTSIFTYKELNCAVNRLAWRILSAHGEKTEPVILLLDDPGKFIVSLLAILKTGKFYVPLDPSFPTARNRSISADSTARLILTDTANLSAAGELCLDDCQVLNVDVVDVHPIDQNPSITINPDTPAFLIYTSGSTGTPKGVLHSQRNIVHNAMRQIEALDVNASDRISMLYSPSVMGMTRDVYNALLSGASLNPYNFSIDGANQMGDWLQSRQITVLHTISSLFRRLESVFQKSGNLASLRAVLLGGEEVTRSDFEIYRKFFPGSTAFFTGLGSTETGTVCVQTLTRDSKMDTATVPVGFPVRDMEVLLFDQDGNPAPKNETGEIAIRSNFLALEYWHQPDQTSQSFIADPSGSGKRIYLSGDLGRFLPNGALIHCGRKDFQIKIKGRRIELLEIESAIMELEPVAEAVVVGHALNSEEKIAVAYIISKKGYEFNPEKIRQELSQKIPDYMVPGLFIHLDYLPRTPNGKINRNLLPQPDFNAIKYGDDLPHNATEETILEIWKKILQIEHIGIRDNFFDMGGDSLKASTLFVEIENRFGHSYPLSTLLAHGTVASLAEFLNDKEMGAKRALVAVKPGGSKPPLFLIPGGIGDTLYFRYLASHLDSEQPLYGLQLLRNEEKLNIAPSIETIATRFLTEIKEIQPQGPYLLGGHSFGGYIALEMAHQLITSGEKVALLVFFDTYPPGPRRQAAWRDRITIHLRKLLAAHSTRERVEYLSVRAQHLAGRLIRVKFLSPVLNKLDVGGQNARVAIRMARYQYHPQKYPGRAALFLANQREWYVTWDPMKNWQKYLSGKLDVYEVSTEHENILFEPFAQKVAEKLTEYIEQAVNIV